MNNNTGDNDSTVLLSGGVPPVQELHFQELPAQDLVGEASGAISSPSPAAATHRSAAESGNALPPGTRLGEFELTGVLGEGGFGIVYTAQDHSLQRRVALKEYMPSSLAQRDGQSQVQVRSERHRDTFEAGLKSFINEARLLAQFDHPSLVKVYRFWEAKGTAYMVMPLYVGTTLKDKLKGMGTPPDEAWLMGMLASLTEALEVIHAENCFHRDIAPDNIILLAETERPLLLDFGAARRVISDMTQALTVILKPGYAPLEQYAEVPEMRQGPWTDVYALAATVYWAVTGRTPPPSVGRLMNDGMQPLAEAAAGKYSPSFLQAIDKALKVRTDERTQSVAALRADLGLPPAGAQGQTQVGATVLNPAPLGTAPMVPPKAATTAHAPPSAMASAVAGDATASKTVSRKPWVFALLGGLVLAVAGGGYLLSQDRSSGAPVVPVAANRPTVPVTAAPVNVAPAGTTTSTPGTPATPAPTGKSFEVRTEFDKVLSGATADFKVQAAPASKTLRIGRDKLAFSVTSARDGFVQVLLLGPDGSLVLLFPNAQSSDNRIKAGQTLKLPQASWVLDTAEPAGPEEFLVIVSAQPRDYSDLSKERDYIFLKLPTGQRGAELASTWTRSTPLLLGGLKVCPSADCEAYGAASFSVTIEH